MRAGTFKMRVCVLGEVHSATHDILYRVSQKLK